MGEECGDGRRSLSGELWGLGSLALTISVVASYIRSSGARKCTVRSPELFYCCLRELVQLAVGPIRDGGLYGILDSEEESGILARAVLVFVRSTCKACG